MPHAGEREDDEDEAFDKDSRESERIGHGACAADADNLIGKVGVQTHTRPGYILQINLSPFFLLFLNNKRPAISNLRQSDREVSEEPEE